MNQFAQDMGNLNIQGNQTATAPVQATDNAGTASTFNAGAAEFVPRKKIVKTTEAFPTLGDAIAKEAPKKKAAPVVQKPVQ